MARYRIHLMQTIVEDVNDEEEALMDIVDNSGYYIHLEKLDDDDDDFSDDEG